MREKATKEVQGHYLIWLLLKSTSCTWKAKQRKYRVTIKLFSKWLKSTSCMWKVNKGSTGWLSSFVKSDWNPLLVRERTIREVQGDYLILRKVTEIYFFYVTSQLGCSGLSLLCWKWQKSTSCTLKVNKGSTGSLFYWTVTEIYFLYMKSQQRKYRVTILLC